MKMADNFYALLSNRVQEIWFDQGVELSGGEPFTVGVEGEERNRRFIVSSLTYLKEKRGCLFIMTEKGG
jgi:hypothetical protein